MQDPTTKCLPIRTGRIKHRTLLLGNLLRKRVLFYAFFKGALDNEGFLVF